MGRPAGGPQRVLGDAEQVVTRRRGRVERVDDLADALEGEAPDLGFLEARSLVGGGGPTVVQYWRSVEDVHAYASDPDRLHRPAWTAFYRRSRRATGAVGIWHETYAVPAGGHESFYVATPPMGLAKAFGATADRSRRRHARLGSGERAA
ncbi:monooxygenase family protein [Intrasporangium sp. YIM S08009]|uniref:monooxygenase family protein n=1 Tax=Intrasporangium zincisolvens TaxID=3080018 RepID=UPI002B05AC22|nr:DUF4188 domain-containing protein [Intrasporangium sp. YIM S08009]